MLIPINNSHLPNNQLHAFTLFFIVFSSILHCLQASYSADPLHSYSSTVIIYESNTPLITDITNQFSISFSIGFQEMPQVAFGIIGYRGKDQLFNQLYIISLEKLTNIGFSLSVLTTHFTSVLYLRISYLAIVDIFDGIEIMSEEFLTFDQIGSGTGVRQQTLSLNLNISSISEQWQSQLFLNGVYLRSNSNFNIQFNNLHITIDNYIQVEVLVTSDCYFELIAILFIFIEPQYLDQSSPYLTNMHYYSIGQFIFEEGSEIQNDEKSIAGIFMMGISGFSNDVSSVVFSYDWDILLDNGSYSFQFKRESSVQGYRFNYFALYRKVCENGQYWDSQLRVCISSCRQNFTIEPKNQICEKCDNICKICLNQPTKCTACFTNFILIDNNCVQQENQESATDTDNSTENQESATDTDSSTKNQESATDTDSSTENETTRNSTENPNVDLEPQNTMTTDPNLRLLGIVCLIPVFLFISFIIYRKYRKMITPTDARDITEHPSIEL